MRTEGRLDSVALPAEAWSELAALSQGGLRGRLLGDHLSHHSELLHDLGLVHDQKTTAEGARLAALSGRIPALMIRGRGDSGEKVAEIRVDGLDALLIADVSFAKNASATEPPGTGERLYSAMLTIGLPSAVLSWSALEVDWFPDVEFTAQMSSLGGSSLQVSGPGGQEDTRGAELVGEMTGAPSTLWTAELPGGQVQLAWIQPEGRGPMLVHPHAGGAGATVQSTTGLELHDMLSTLIRDIARGQSDTVVP